jgi:predicted acyl esterase
MILDGGAGSSRIRRALGALVACLVVVLGSPAARAQEDGGAPPHTVERVTVESFDGTKLGGWIIRPKTNGAPVPTILISSPYLGQCVKISFTPLAPCWPTPESPEDWAQHPEPAAHLLKWGYAVAWFSVRGTGVSGGCWEDMGDGEQKDQKALVDWIASQPWSNRKVGAMGISYMSQTAIAAATQRPKALKTIVVGGIMADAYTFFHTPQGLPLYYTYFNEPLYGVDISWLPPGIGYQETGVLAGHLPSHLERACPEVLKVMTEGPKGAATGVRDGDFWLERRLMDDLKEISASVMIAQGFHDLSGSGHQMQDDPLWPLIPTHKAMILGQWGHVYPWQVGLAPHPPREDLKRMWLTTLRSWFDHFLKEGPKPEILNKVMYEDESGDWRRTSRWQPADARSETLFLAADQSLSPRAPAQESSETFRSFARPDTVSNPATALCASELDAAASGVGFMTDPVRRRTVVAGNPVAYLDLESDQDGGALQVTLHDVGPDFSCSEAGLPRDVRTLTFGGADLRFHKGNFAPEPFSDGHVRVDIANLAAVLEPGHRLALTVGYPDPAEYISLTTAPSISVRTGPRPDASQLLVPVVEGGFGGRPPRAEIPARPR